LSGADPYAELAELAEAALELSRDGNEQGAAEVLDRSAALASELPGRPPVSARPALERAAAAQERLTVWLDAKLVSTRSELELVDRGRHAAHSYAGTGAVLLDQQA
jgi:hypothetical protein